MFLGVRDDASPGGGCCCWMLVMQGVAVDASGGRAIWLAEFFGGIGNVNAEAVIQDASELAYRFVVFFDFLLSIAGL